jgi:hypothetical protein
MSYPETTQDKSGHLKGTSGPTPKPSGSVPDGQSKSGYTDAAGAVNSGSPGGSAMEGQDERGYTKNGTDSRSTAKTKDGVGAGLPRVS